MRDGTSGDRPGMTPLKRFFFAAVLWLPAMFFVWVYWSSVFALPATSIARGVLASQYDGIFAGVWRGFPRHLVAGGAEAPVLPGSPTEGRTVRDDHLLTLRFNEQAMPPAMQQEKAATGEEPLPSVNSMIYGYGLAVIWGLVLATPLTARRRMLQMLAGWMVIALVQAFGCITGALVLALRFLGAESVTAQGIHPELLALAYQFGYLILPAVVPVVLWMLMNRRFIEILTGRGAEPPPDAPVVFPASSGATAEPTDTHGH
jgi:hypothetical protein